MDYSRITADPVRGPEIGKLYIDASPFITTLARVAYRQFIDQVSEQFFALVDNGLKIRFRDYDPYADAQEMFTDVGKGWLAVWSTPEEQGHPILSARSNNMFRAVHDYHGHYMTGRDFSRHGEEAAWVRHSQMFTGLARRAMTTETRGQSSAFIWINGGREFPQQKAVLLPDWVSEIPAHWQ